MTDNEVESWVKAHWMIERLLESAPGATVVMALDCCRDKRGAAPDEPLDGRLYDSGYDATRLCFCFFRF
jgi:hypothetical protein